MLTLKEQHEPRADGQQLFVHCGSATCVRRRARKSSKPVAGLTSGWRAPNLEEVEATHAKTLKVVVEKANKLTREAEERIRAEEARQAADEKAHADHVEAVGKRIKFD